MTMFWLLFGVTLVLSNSVADERIDGCPDVQVVQNFDLYKYLGKWYEHAKYPNSFEKEGKCISAEYSKNDDGKVRVVNSMINNRTNEARSTEGSARLNSENLGEGKLLVYFKVAAAEAPYWILDTDYANYAVVWNCWKSPKQEVRKTAWILTRSQNPSDNIINAAIAVMKKQNLDTDTLIRTDQKHCD
ncbi:unnamed protein product [Psylliodes chrysocephalus]|uniref:Apolipoprotein D n=1 Tax=Psylliodes chrysocephalus TaxID=3402493 RepID=A0A9P0CUD7_9CUCU|nr:unnamed protein product [Psylliodes chrysocephala]